MNTAKVIFAHVFRCNIVRDVLKKITPFAMLTSISHSLCLVPVCIHDFLIYQFARNIIRSGVCNIILHAEIEYKRNHDLFYSLNVSCMHNRSGSIKTGKQRHTHQ
jgi:hypothetical protein